MKSGVCKICNKPTFHHATYDNYLCALCNTWNENICNESDCYYCSILTDKPLTYNIHSIILESYEEGGFKFVKELVNFYLHLEYGGE